MDRGSIGGYGVRRSSVKGELVGVLIAVLFIGGLCGWLCWHERSSMYKNLNLRHKAMQVEYIKEAKEAHKLRKQLEHVTLERDLMYNILIERSGMNEGD